jgi:hypothetical protein
MDRLIESGYAAYRSLSRSVKGGTMGLDALYI